MDPWVLGTIANGVIAVVAPVAAYVLKSFFDNRSKIPMSPKRRNAVSGDWEGTVHQESGPDNKPIDYAAVLSVEAGRKTVSGTLDTRPATNADSDVQRFTVSGGFLYEHYLHLNYISKDKSVIQFGSMVLKLTDNNKELNGMFIGYGKTSGTIVSGSATARKRP